MLRRLSSESFNGFKTPVVKTKLFSLFSFAYQWPFVIKYGLNTRLNNKTSCSRNCIHFRLTVVSRITVVIVSLNVNAAFSPRSSPFAG